MWTVRCIFPWLTRELRSKQALEHLKVPRIQIMYSMLIGFFLRQKKSSFSLGNLSSFSKSNTEEYRRSYEKYRKRKEKKELKEWEQRKGVEWQILVASDGEHQKGLWERKKEKATVFLLRCTFVFSPHNITVTVVQLMASEYCFWPGGSFDLVVIVQA